MANGDPRDVQIRERMRELVVANTELAHLKADLAVKSDYIVHLQDQIAEMTWALTHQREQHVRFDGVRRIIRRVPLYKRFVYPRTARLRAWLLART